MTTLVDVLRQAQEETAEAMRELADEPGGLLHHPGRKDGYLVIRVRPGKRRLGSAWHIVRMVWTGTQWRRRQRHVRMTDRDGYSDAAIREAARRAPDHAESYVAWEHQARELRRRYRRLSTALARLDARDAAEPDADIAEVGVPEPARIVLREHGVHQKSDVAVWSARELRALEGVGPATVQRLSAYVGE